jgi:hypothetical protein
MKKTKATRVFPVSVEKFPVGQTKFLVLTGTGNLLQVFEFI